MENDRDESNPLSDLEKYFNRRIQEYIEDQIGRGKTREEVLDEIKKSGDSNDGITRTILQESGFFSPPIDELFVWTLNPSADSLRDFGDEDWEQVQGAYWSAHPIEAGWSENLLDGHCSSCLYQASLPPRRWDEIPYPTTQPTRGDTNCANTCLCTLEPYKPG